MKEKFYIITIITRREKEEHLKEAMKKIGVEGMTITQVEGNGVQEGAVSYVENGKGVVMLIPKIMVEIMTMEEKTVNKIIDTAVEICRTGLMGDGKIFVEECLGKIVRIRTREENHAAMKVQQ